MEFNDETLQKSIQLFEHQLEKVQQEGINPDLQKILTEVEKIQAEPFSIENTEKMLALVQEFQEKLKSFSGESNSQSSGGGPELDAGQREVLQNGMKQSLAAARNKQQEAEKPSQKKISKGMRRGRRSMI